MMEAGIATIRTQLHWDAAFTKNILELLKKEACIEFKDGMVKLTDQGRAASIHSYEELFQS
jgi:manganese/zinc/iron transport system permease protein